MGYIPLFYFSRLERGNSLGVACGLCISVSLLFYGYMYRICLQKKKINFSITVLRGKLNAAIYQRKLRIT